MKSVIIKDQKGNLLLKIKRTKTGVEVVKFTTVDVQIKVILSDGSIIQRFA